MNNFNILRWGSWKNPILKEGKPISKGDCLKGDLWTVCRFIGWLGKKEGGGIFEEGGMIHLCTHTIITCYIVILNSRQ